MSEQLATIADAMLTQSLFDKAECLGDLFRIVLLHDLDGGIDEASDLFWRHGNVNNNGAEGFDIHLCDWSGLFRKKCDRLILDHPYIGS